MIKGYRVDGPRKSKVINTVNLHLAQLGAKGVNVRVLMKMIGVTSSYQSLTTKRWIGVLGRIVQFRRENNV